MDNKMVRKQNGISTVHTTIGTGIKSIDTNTKVCMKPYQQHSSFRYDRMA